MERSAISTRGRPRRRWPLVGLVLALAFLGHDLLMAGVASAAPHDVRRATHLDPRHDGAAPAISPSDGPPAPDHPAGCETTRPTARRAGDDPEPAGPPPASRATGPLLPPPAAPGDVARGEPTWPPATRRALLQVYRI